MRNISVLQENVVDFAEGHKIPGRATYNQLYYWAKKGLLMPDGTRVTLEFAKRGGGLATSLEAIKRFWERTNGGGK